VIIIFAASQQNIEGSIAPSPLQFKPQGAHVNALPLLQANTIYLLIKYSRQNRSPGCGRTCVFQLDDPSIWKG